MNSGTPENGEDQPKKHDEILALTEQVKILAQCVNKLVEQKIVTSQENEIPESLQTQTSGSSLNPILISSDEEKIIKKEKGTDGEEIFTTDSEEIFTRKPKPRKLRKRRKRRAYRRNKKKARISDSSSDNSSSSSNEKLIYTDKKDMPADLIKSLRLKVIRLYDQMQESERLQLSKTFESQRDVVTHTIVPSITKALKTMNSFSVTDNVIYQMIHSLHKHRREEHLRRDCSPTHKKNQEKRKHSNSRRSEKRLRRAKIIKQLQLIHDPLIQNFKDTQLQPILDNNSYHSPEDSETDNGEKIIVIKDLQWRSSTLRNFLRNYLDRIAKEQSKKPKKRKRIFDQNFSEKEVSAPLLAPKWTCNNYHGRLEQVVAKSCGLEELI